MIGTIAGILMATVLNNGGGAWDNAKLHVLIKLLSTITLVLAPLFIL
jgi:K(+)-stimulated pyrophosphate-energized sodium pump